MTEIRWHARAGQGAKTAAQLLALALLRGGKSVRRSPNTGPSAAARRCAHSRASTTCRSAATTRSTHPDVVVVLEPSLLHEVDVAEGLRRTDSSSSNAEQRRRARRRRRALRARGAARRRARSS